MKYYLISGEASGDLHGANLVKNLQLIDSQAEIRAWGGNNLRHVGATVVKDYKDTAFMGFGEVIRNLSTIRKLFHFCHDDIENFRPDLIILVDYPGFNLRIAKWAKRKGYRIAYYIAPQVWAWKKNRIKSMKRDIDRLFVILPFEKEFFRDEGMEASFFGHPLVEHIHAFVPEPEFIQKNKLGTKPIIALLPGSRKQEISKILPHLTRLSASMKEYQFVVAGVSSVDPQVYASHLYDSEVLLVLDQTYDLLSQSQAAIVASGTATLETALFKVPQIVIYQTSNFNYQVAKRLVKLKHISLVNLILNLSFLPEYIQEFSDEDLFAATKQMLQPTRKTYYHEGYELLTEKLQGSQASKRVAQEMYQMVIGD